MPLVEVAVNHANEFATKIYADMHAKLSEEDLWRAMLMAAIMAYLSHPAVREKASRKTSDEIADDVLCAIGASRGDSRRDEREGE